MSRFGQRMVNVRAIIDREFLDDFTYTPMLEQVNAIPIPDGSRMGGTVRAGFMTPGIELGTMNGLNSMHPRSSERQELFYEPKGLLADVRKYDLFTLNATNTYPDRVPQRFEVLDGPQPYGFGIYVVELTQKTPTPEPAVDYDPPF
jgi:hypothetical protein